MSSSSLILFFFTVLKNAFVSFSTFLARSFNESISIYSTMLLDLNAKVSYIF